MSDDRYNQNQRHGGSQNGDNHQQDDYGEEDEKTQLVDLDALQSGGEEPQFAPPPTMDSADDSRQGGNHASPPVGDDHHDPGEKTELFEMPPSGDDGGAITSSAPDYGGESFGSQSSAQQDPPPPSGPAPPVDSGSGQYPSTDHGSHSGGVSGNFSSVDDPEPSVGGNVSSPDPSGRGRDQVYIPGDDDAGHDGATAFINVDKFAEEEAHFTPEQEQAGYDGSTQFVDINALQSGGPGAGGTDPIANDDDLHRGYQFGDDDIRRGEITLIYGQNALGKDVILKRVWEDAPHTMSAPLRERIAELHELQHPHLLSMNGMFVSDSGMWVELEGLRGQRLTSLIEQHGRIDPDMVLEWMEPVAEVLEVVHANQLAYANLTTDSIWIGDNGHVIVEPFDMLRLDDRGNLGAFGPPEMDAPPEQRNLSPATDVYSLAAVIGAAISGLPFRAQHLEESDEKLSKKLLPALHPDPGQRPPTIAGFRDSLSGGFDLANPDIKIVGAAVFAVLIAGIGVVGVIGGDDDSTDQPDDQAHAQADGAHDETAKNRDDSASESGDEFEATDDEVADDEPALDLPDTVEEDARLTIHQSFEHNPPEDAIELASEHQLDQWRAAADEALERADKADSGSDEQLDYYSEALEALTRVVRKQQDPPQHDRDAWREIYEKDSIQEQLEETIETIDEPIVDGRLGIANRRYHRLSRYVPDADVHSFLNAQSSAPVVSLGSDDDEDDE